MSILDTTPDETLVEFRLDHETVVSPQTVTTTVEPTTPHRRSAREGGAVAHVVAAMRGRSLTAFGTSFFTEPAVYEEYRTSLARHDVASDESLRE